MLLLSVVPNPVFQYLHGLVLSVCMLFYEHTQKLKPQKHVSPWQGPESQDREDGDVPQGQ